MFEFRNFNTPRGHNISRQMFLRFIEVHNISVMFKHQTWVFILSKLQSSTFTKQDNVIQRTFVRNSSDIVEGSQP